MKESLVVIPARYGSTRFPGKVLAKLGARRLIEWCYRAAQLARVGPVIIATEDRRVVLAAEEFGGKAVLTSPRCLSGTDRVHEAARRYKTPFIINLQGDQPLIRPSTIRAVAQLLRENPKADMATAVIPLKEKRRLHDPNVVKAALGRGGRVLYFSRSAIPYSRNGDSPARYEHLGIYGFRRRALERFARLPPSLLEKAEGLEQLRALEEGLALYAAVVLDVPASIDTPQDFRRVARMLKESL